MTKGKEVDKSKTLKHLFLVIKVKDACGLLERGKKIQQEGVKYKVKAPCPSPNYEETSISFLKYFPHAGAYIDVCPFVTF